MSLKRVLTTSSVVLAVAFGGMSMPAVAGATTAAPASVPAAAAAPSAAAAAERSVGTTATARQRAAAKRRAAQLRAYKRQALSYSRAKRRSFISAQNYVRANADKIPAEIRTSATRQLSVGRTRIYRHHLAIQRARSIAQARRSVSALRELQASPVVTLVRTSIQVQNRIDDPDALQALLRQLLGSDLADGALAPLVELLESTLDGLVGGGDSDGLVGGLLEGIGDLLAGLLGGLLGTSTGR